MILCCQNISRWYVIIILYHQTCTLYLHSYGVFDNSKYFYIDFISKFVLILISAFFSGVKFSDCGDVIVSTSKDGSIIAWSNNDKYKKGNDNNNENNDSINCTGSQKNNFDENLSRNNSVESEYSKIASVSSTGKIFTDLAVLSCDNNTSSDAVNIDSPPTGNEKLKETGKRKAIIDSVISSFDGSLSHYTLQEKNKISGGKVKIGKKSESSEKETKNEYNYEFALIDYTSAYSPIEEST